MANTENKPYGYAVLVYGNDTSKIFGVFGGYGSVKMGYGNANIGYVNISMLANWLEALEDCLATTSDRRNA